MSTTAKTTVVPMLLLLLTSAPATKAEILTVPCQRQEGNNWCWASGTQAILGFDRNETTIPISVTQVEIATRACQRQGWLSDSDCAVYCPAVSYDVPVTPPLPPEECDHTNSFNTSVGSVRDLLISWDSAGSVLNLSNPKLYLHSIPPSWVVAEIDSRHMPFLARWGWYNDGGHVLVVSGILNGNIYYHDPDNGVSPGVCGYNVAPYNQFVNVDGDHLWNETLLMAPVSLFSDEVPTLSPWGIALLTSALLAFGIYWVNRRKRRAKVS